MFTKTRTTKAFTVLLVAVMLFAFVVFPLTACDKLFSKKPTRYTVTFDSNGGSEVIAQEVDAGGYANRPDDPKKAGYTFDGWYKDINIAVEWNFSSDAVSENITLHAKWTEKVGVVVYTVTFDSNGGSAVNAQDVEAGDKLIKPADPTRAGYTFNGWYKDNQHKTAWNFNADKVNGNITLYAKWTEKPNVVIYTVTFDSNGGSAVNAQSAEAGGKVNKPVDPTRAGYTFDGWYKDNSHTTVWNFSSDTVTGNTTLYAKWTENASIVVYTVTFNANGGSAVTARDVEAGGKVSKPADPTRAGYTFGGWYKDNQYKTAWNFSSDTVTKNTTLYAKWTPNAEPIDPADGEVTATFNVGYKARVAGASNPAPQRVESGSKITEPTVTLSGCTITGWYTDEKVERKWNFATDVLTNDTTLFARWSGTFPSVGSGGSGGGGGGAEADDYTPTMKESGYLYIHYLRSDSSYDGWHIWAWSGDNAGQWIDEKADTDKSGAVYKIKLSAISATTSAKFIVARGDWAEKDGGDNELSLSSAQKVENSYHWYVQSGKVADGTPYLAKQSEQSDGKVDRSFAKNLNVMNTAENTDDMGVGYQIFVASFCDSNGDGMGDIRGIINKLDYLDSLNVDLLWLTPIQSSDSYHGYDCYDYYAIDSKFGTNADYRELVYKAHQRGMKIVMDLVVNHTSPKNEWFIKSKAGVKEEVTYQDGTTKLVDYTNYYRWSGSEKNRYFRADNGKYFYSSFGSGMPELNYDYQPARDAMADVAMYWMAYGLDGFRMDAIKHMFMWDESTNEQGDVEGRPEEASSGYNFNLTKDVEWFKEFNYRLKTKYPYAFTLGENLTGDVSAVAPFYAGMDSLFDFNTYYDLPTNIKSSDASKTANALNSNANAYASARNGAGRAINSMITSNHDVPRLAYQCGKNVSYQKLYFAVMMTMPGLSWIYYGDEIGMYSGSGDDRLSRQPMKWTASWANKALPSDVPNQHYDDDLLSVADQTSESTLLYYVKSLTKLRNDHPALIHGNATCSAQDGMLKIVVTSSEETITVFHNFSGSTKTASASGNVIFGNASVPAYGTVAYSNK